MRTLQHVTLFYARRNNALENRYGGNLIVGSNPTPSASLRHERLVDQDLRAFFCRFAPDVYGEFSYVCGLLDNLGDQRFSLEYVIHSSCVSFSHVGQSVLVTVIVGISGFDD